MNKMGYSFTMNTIAKKPSTEKINKYIKDTIKTDTSKLLTKLLSKRCAFEC